MDRYQGRDKSVIVLSLVRSNGEGAVGRLLADVRRVNVALTRAKHKLVLLGSANTVTCTPVLASLLHLLRQHSWVRHQCASQHAFCCKLLWTFLACALVLMLTVC